MRKKILIAVLSAGFMLFAFSNKAVSQTANEIILPMPTLAQTPQKSGFAFRPPVIAAWQDESGSLPGLGLTSGDKIILISCGVVIVAGVTALIIRNHKRHHHTNKLGSLLNPNFDFNLAFNNNLKEVGFRYAFK